LHALPKLLSPLMARIVLEPLADLMGVDFSRMLGTVFLHAKEAAPGQGHESVSMLMHLGLALGFQEWWQPYKQQVRVCDHII